MKDDLLVRAHLHDTGQTQAEVAFPGFRLEREAKPKLAHVKCHGRVRALGGIAYLVFVATNPSDRFRVLRDAYFCATGMAHRQRHIDRAVAGVLGQVQGRGMIHVEGNIEGGTVLENASALRYREFPNTQEFMVDPKLGDAPSVGPQCCDPLADQVLEIAVLLLKMLGLKEHAFRPHHFVVPRHAHTRPLLVVTP